MPSVLILSSLTPSVPQCSVVEAAETRDNETRHWNVDDYMVARRERWEEREGARRPDSAGCRRKRERTKIAAVEFVVPDEPLCPSVAYRTVSHEYHDKSYPKDLFTYK